jgi:type I restriction enzyme, S subunit
LGSIIEQDAANPRTRARLHDVLLTTVGTIGNAAVANEDIVPANMDRHLGIIRIRQNVDVDPYYLATFLNSELGRFQTWRESTGNVQLNLFIEKIKTLLVPIGNSYNAIGDKTRLAYAKYRESKALYIQAQSLLTAELGLDKLVLPPNNISIRHFSGITTTTRIDAEYYHPQKAYIQQWLDKLPGKPISAYFGSVREIYTPSSIDTGKSILNFDLTDALRYFVDENGPTIPENEIGSLKKRMKNGDVIISRLRSYLKEIALVEVPQEVACVGSSEFIVLRSLSQELYPEALNVYLRSEPAQTILKWSQDGSNHPRFQENELLAIKIPDQVLNLQDEIRGLLRSGIDAYRDAQRLLVEAKAAVEQLIEGVS